MPGVKELILYSTEGCHLCDEALEVIRRALEEPCALTVVEIAHAPELLERYGVRIPVLRVEGESEELGWPFDAAAVQRFLARV